MTPKNAIGLRTPMISATNPARSAEAKHQREQAILTAAAALGTHLGIRRVTLTDIADVVGT